MEKSGAQSLGLFDFGLTALPESLGQLTQIRSLDVSDNKLAALPATLGNLTQIQTLDVSYNQLTALPEFLGQLARLESLDVSYNHLGALPRSLLLLPALKELYLHGNDALGIPREVLGPTWSEVRALDKKPAVAANILDYYFSSRGRDGRPLREFKLIVVGRGGAGKTSLINRLKGKRLDPNERETHGIVISPLEFQCHDGPVTARVWDFGGQHVLHAMHEFFLTARSLYLLVIREREEMADRDAAYWLQLIRSYAGNAPVVVAVNKSHGRLREMDRLALEKNYGPILAWVPTECDDSFAETIEDLRVELTQAADNLVEVRTVFPGKWWKIKKWLEEMDQPFLDFATFEKRCGELGEADGDEQEKLAAWLHDLGVALNYARDPRLRDTTVLRPEWLANGIYAILRANDWYHYSLVPNAMLTAEMLGPIYAAAEKVGILKTDDYPAEKWPFLLRLMTMFQLAYPLDENAHHLLVPTLLPVEPPRGSDEPTEAGRIRLQYEPTVVPRPLVPRFLVRTFSLIEDQCHWRRGAILRFGGARARVWETDERWVYVTVAGPKRARDGLLTMVRGTLEELFAEYKDLHVKERWEHDGEWVPRHFLMTTLETNMLAAKDAYWKSRQMLVSMDAPLADDNDDDEEVEA